MKKVFTFSDFFAKMVVLVAYILLRQSEKGLISFTETGILTNMNSAISKTRLHTIDEQSVDVLRSPVNFTCAYAWNIGSAHM